MIDLGIIWGISMVSQDLFNYNLYLLLLNIDGITCENFIKYYTMFLLITTVVSGLFYPVSGWLTDHVKNINLFYLFTVILQLILFFAQYIVMIKNNNMLYLLFIIWGLLQLLFIQNNNLLWKIVKINTSSIYENELEMINRVGNIGDLSSDITESVTLSILLFLLMYFREGIFKYVELYFFISMNILNITLLILSIISYVKRRTEFNIVETIQQSNDNNKNKCNWLIINIKKFYNNKIMYHIFWHCMVLLIYSLFVQYPLSLLTVNIIDVNTKMNLHNLCGGKIINIMFLGCVTNICYLFGSIVYRIFIVKMPPKPFYKYWYIVGTIILLIVSVVLLFNVNYIVLFI